MNPTCTKAGLLAPCYLSPGPITPKEQKALLLKAMMLELAAIGGTDYNGRLSLMLQDAATLACGMGEEDIRAGLVQIAYNRASAVGGQVPVGIQAQIKSVLCLIEADERQLDETLLLLTCKLGVHKSYPQ